MIRRLPTELDRLAADLVKRLAGYRCERCGTQYSTRIGTHGRVICDGLDWAHLITRRRKKTRWLPAAAVALCAGCHFYLDGNPHAKIAFAVKRLGATRYDALRLQSQAAGKVDRVMVGLALEQELKNLRKLERSRKGCEADLRVRDAAGGPRGACPHHVSHPS